NVRGRLLSDHTLPPQGVREPPLHPHPQAAREGAEGASKAHPGRPRVALSTLVAQLDEDDSDTPSTASSPMAGPLPRAQGSPLPPAPPIPSQVGDNRLHNIQERLARGGFDKGVLELILQGYKNPSDKKGTLRTHQRIWEKFLAFCGGDSDKAMTFEV